MESYVVKVSSIEKINHDVLRVVVERPAGYCFTPGQATELAINKGHWRHEKRAFTFTGLPEDPFLEFTIKTYPFHKGVTNHLLSVRPNDELLIHDAWGAISYQGEGIFIAGGAGITPFLSIFRQLHQEKKINNNRLIFANKTKADIIYEKELNRLLGDRCMHVLSEEMTTGYEYGYVTKELLKKNFSGTPARVYLCGPSPMMDSLLQSLSHLGIHDDCVVMEM